MVLVETPVWLLPILTEVVWLRTRAAPILFTVFYLLGVNWSKRFVTKLPFQLLTPKIVSLAFLEPALYCGHAFRFLKPKTASRSLLRRYCDICPSVAASSY